MPRETVDFEVARSIGMELPSVTGSTGNRGLALKIKGRILACRAIHRSAEPDTLMVRIGSERRDALLAQNPDAFYVTKHYEPHAAILVRLSRISRADLSAVLAQAWEFVWSEA